MNEKRNWMKKGAKRIIKCEWKAIKKNEEKKSKRKEEEKDLFKRVDTSCDKKEVYVLAHQAYRAVRRREVREEKVDNESQTQTAHHTHTHAHTHLSSGLSQYEISRKKRKRRSMQNKRNSFLFFFPFLCVFVVRQFEIINWLFISFIHSICQTLNIYSSCKRYSTCALAHVHHDQHNARLQLVDTHFPMAEHKLWIRQSGCLFTNFLCKI